MIARRLGLAIGVVTLVASLIYLFVYLYRWEWNRALTAGVFVIVSESALLGAALFERLRRIEARLDQRPAPPAAAVTAALGRLEETAPEAHDHFAWLNVRSGSTNVFVPVLMGAGVVLSALAWAVERLARATARPVLEHRLADRVAGLALPEGGFLSRRQPEPVPADVALLLAPVPASPRPTRRP